MNLDINSLTIQKLNISDDITKTKFQYSIYSTKPGEFSAIYDETEFGKLIEDYLQWFSIKYIGIHKCNYRYSVSHVDGWYIEIDGKCWAYVIEGKKNTNEFFSIWEHSNDFFVPDGSILNLKNKVEQIILEYKRSQFMKV